MNLTLDCDTVATAAWCNGKDLFLKSMQHTDTKGECFYAGAYRLSVDKMRIMI